MKKKPQPMGKLGLSPRLEPHISSLDSRENKRIRAQRIERVKNTSNALFTKIGETVLNGLHSAAITDAPSENPRHLRNFGRRIAAGVAVSAVLFTGAIVAEHLNPTSGDCVSVSLDDLGTTDPIEGARAVSNQFVGEDVRPNAVKMAQQFDDQGFVKECKNPGVKHILSDLANN